MKLTKLNTVKAVMTCLIFFSLAINVNSGFFKTKKSRWSSTIKQIIGGSENYYKILVEENAANEENFRYLAWSGWALRVTLLKGFYAPSGLGNFENAEEYVKFLGTNAKCTLKQVEDILDGKTDNWLKAVDSAMLLTREIKFRRKDGCSLLKLIYEKEIGETGKPLYCQNIYPKLSNFHMDPILLMIRIQLLFDYFRNCMNYNPKIFSKEALAKEKEISMLQNVKLIEAKEKKIKESGLDSTLEGVIRWGLDIHGIVDKAEEEVKKYVDESKDKTISGTEIKLGLNKKAVIYLIFYAFLKQGVTDKQVMYTNFSETLDIKKLLKSQE